MRAVFFATLLLLAACAPLAQRPAPVDLESKAVALVEDDGEGGLHAFCSGVWLSESTIATARHCTRELEVGDPINFVVHSDVFAPASYKERESITPHIATLAAIDDEHDLALLTTQARVPHMSAHLSLTTVRQGDHVATMGTPIGLWWSYSSGEVSALRYLTGEDTLYVQTTAPTSPGNSGGALFDVNGDVIGICHGGFRAGQNLNIYVSVGYLDALVRAPRGT